MKLKKVVFLMVVSLFCPCAQADEVSHRSAAEELLLLTNIDEMMKPMWEQMEAMMQQQFVQMDAAEELRPVLNRYTSKLVRIMEEELGWAMKCSPIVGQE